jgi:Recombinase.
MRTIPYGYRIENGLAVVEENEAKILQQAYELYLAGDSLQAIANKLGIDRNPSSMSNLLADRRYLGTDFYPSIINKELFAQAQRIHQERKQQHGRPLLSVKPTKVSTDFIREQTNQHFDDPYAQAQYVYSLIKVKE